MNCYSCLPGVLPCLPRRVSESPLIAPWDVRSSREHKGSIYAMMNAKTVVSTVYTEHAPDAVGLTVGVAVGVLAAVAGHTLVLPHTPKLTVAPAFDQAQAAVAAVWCETHAASLKM